MINTNKKIHIYNRFRTIYSSKNRYYIQYNKKYIDLYTVIIKINNEGLLYGGGKKDEPAFLQQELTTIKNSIVIFKLLNDDKQSEAINIYLNLIELINSKREIILNKINTYPLNYFDNELNKSAIITYVKNMLSNNIFNNYLLNIIPRIDIKNFIIDNDKDIIYNIITLLHHLKKEGASDTKVFKDIMSKIEKYKEIIEKTIKENCNDYDKLKGIIEQSIDKAIEIVETEKNNDEEKENVAPKNNEEISKIITENMIAIKEGLDNLENKDYVDVLLPVLEKESKYYELFINSDESFFDNDKLKQYFTDLKNFLGKYIELYIKYDINMKSQLEEKIANKSKKSDELNSLTNDITQKEIELNSIKDELNSIKDKLNSIKKDTNQLALNTDNKTLIVDINKRYSSCIATIKDLKIQENDLSKDVENLNNKIRTIEKKLDQYKDFLIKMNKFIKTIEQNILKCEEKTLSKKVEYGNISQYKNYIEKIIYDIKTKILYYFILNYIEYCENLNNIIEIKGSVFTNYNKLNQYIIDLYVSVESSSLVELPLTQIRGPLIQPIAPVVQVGRGRASVCAYITDVEGNLDFFEKYVRISKVIEWTDSKKNRLRFKKNDSMLVFGGDCQDRGIGDIRFVNLLLNFKSEYPNRVEFIIGNRDANKIRISSELSEKVAYADDRAVGKYLAKYDKFPYWVNDNERITLRKYLKDNDFKINTVSRLKYILDYTMGSNDSFDKRRKELSIILNKIPSSISDDDIVASFLNSVSPNPINIKNTNDNYMLKYLINGKIAYIFGEHIFVHGAINKYNIGYIPNNKKIVDNVDKWVSGLNEWFHEDLKEYIANPEYGGIGKKRKGYKIIDYVVPSVNKTVVYSDNLKKGNGQYINTNVIKYLNKGGIHSIISGHKPHGDCPLVLRSKNLIAVSADTSYSKKGHKSKWGVDNRGVAVSEVLLYLNGDIQIHGILKDNIKYDYIINNNKEKNPDKHVKHHPKYDKYIGLQLKNNYWVKNVIYEKKTNNAIYLLSYGKGFEYDEKWITEKEIIKLL